MLSMADSRKRADDCMMKAACASDRDGHFQWQVLADLWLMYAERVDRGKPGHETPAPVATGKTSVIESGERLRAQLHLVN
jgi:hypothetical protein